MKRTTKFDQIPTRLWEGIEPGTRAGRFVGTATCCECGESEEWTSNRMPAPDVVVAKFKSKGWTVRHARPTCPKCSNVRKEKPAMSMPAEQPRPVLKVGGEKPVPSDAARQQRRLAFMAIEDRV